MFAELWERGIQVRTWEQGCYCQCATVKPIKNQPRLALLAPPQCPVSQQLLGAPLPFVIFPSNASGFLFLLSLGQQPFCCLVFHKGIIISLSVEFIDSGRAPVSTGTFLFYRKRMSSLWIATRITIFMIVMWNISVTECLKRNSFTIVSPKYNNL